MDSRALWWDIHAPSRSGEVGQANCKKRHIEQMGFSLLTGGRNSSIVRQFVIIGTSSGQDLACSQGCGFTP
jgi:hypothetical protein